MLVPERIEVDQGERVVITWEDGRRDELTAADLRSGCSCAACREPAGVARIKAVLAGPEPVRIAAARLVGDYAVGFDFEPDDHRSGIFSFELLRSLGASEH